MRQTERALTAIAYKDDNGNWRAGSESGAYDRGKFVPESYAKSARGTRKYYNDIARVMRLDEVDEFQNAKDMVDQYRDWYEQLQNDEISQKEFKDLIGDMLGY